MKNRKPILLVEDDRIDAMIIQRAFKETNINNKLIVTKNGEETLSLLNNRKTEKPCLIITDIKMPRMNGIELLKKLKQDDEFRKIPVIVLTTSKEDQDRVESFNQSAAGFIVKPADYSQFLEVTQAIKLYWSRCELPS